MKTHSEAIPTPGTTGQGHAFRLDELPWLSWVLLLVSGVVALGPLAPTWTANSNYSFGWWIPVVCVILFAERWPMRPAREEIGSPILIPRIILWGLLFLAFRLAAEADPNWRPGLWVLVGLYVLTLITWLWLEGGVSWVRHFAFPVCFLFLCVPWPFAIEYPLVQGLMRRNAVLVADSLQFLGIFAEPAGNIIQLRNCQLGVEEACSGILSLQASLVMGCLLGDIYRLTARRRFLLVLASMTLALIGNYLRTFFLALMAFYSGADAVPQWHDTAGYAILVFTAIGSWGAALAFFTDKGLEVPAKVSQAVGDKSAQARRSFRFAVTIFAITIMAEAVTQAWFGWNESHLSHHPEWTVQFPESMPSFKRVALSDVTLEALRYDKSETAEWQDGHGWNWTAYWFQYEPKPYTKVVVSWHIPDSCLPSIGLIKDKDYPDLTIQVKGLDLHIHPKKFLSKNEPVYIFWLVYPLQGGPPVENYSTTSMPISVKFRSHLQDVWNGYRGVGAETLEVAIMGPESYDTAKASYLEALKAMAVPRR